MLDEVKLTNMILDLKCLEIWLEKHNWEDEDKILDYNELQEKIINYLKDIMNLKIRRLTPKECWRLMGFDDVDIEKASKVNSNAQLYKQAGNSIVVNVLEAIFKNLLYEYMKPPIIFIKED